MCRVLDQGVGTPGPSTGLTLTEGIVSECHRAECSSLRTQGRGNDGVRFPMPANDCLRMRTTAGSDVMVVAAVPALWFNA